MRLVRWFSTIVRRSQQQLYEPYVRPLNKEQQRKLRKQELKAVSKLHANIRGDLEFLLSKSEASEERKQQRQDVHKQVSSIVESHFGADFEVEDISLWRYSQDIQEAPFEFVVVDKRHKLGLSGVVDPTTLPGVYDPVQLSKVFLQEGISGVFYSREKLQKNTMKLRYKNGYAIPPTLDVIVNWPKYERQHAKELLYPPTMQATWPVPFYLTLPGPTILPLVDLLKTYCAAAPTIIPKLISVLYIWMRSLGIHGFMPMCVALLVTQFLQQNAGLPNLQAPPRAYTSTAPSNVSQSADKPLAWVIQEYLQHPKPPKWSMRPYQVDMSFIRESKKIGGTPIAHLLLKFFDLWREDSISASPKVISVREGQPIAREQELMKDVYSTSQVQPVPDVGAIEYLDFQPSQWQYQNLVVQDPFVFTHNHAEFISRTMFEYFIVYARRTAGILRRGHPLSDIFGPHLQVPLPSGSAPERLRVRRVALEHRRSIGKRQPQWGLRSQYHSSAAQHTPASEFELVELPKLVYKKRALTLRRIGSLIKEKYHPKYTVKVFGSTCYNVDSVNSDIDLVIIDPERPSGFAPFVGSPKLPRIYNIRLLARIISAAGYLHVRPVPFATVPIVKFTDPVTGLSCDINVNERLGLVNTAMIRRYCDLEPVLRPLLVAIKAWAKPLGLNDPSGSKGFPTFSSYALTIMAIALFQTTGLLPNLQANVEAVPKTFKSTFWLRKRNDTFVQCDLRYSLRKDWTSEENITPRQALADWFYYWGATHDCGTDAVSLRHGGILPRWKLTEDHSSLDTAVINGLTDDRHLEGRSEGGDSPTSEADSGGSPPLGVPNDPFPWLAPLYVADPFIPAKNLTSRISHTDIKRFREECLRAYQMLETGSTIEELLLGLRKRPAKHYDWMHVNPTVPEDPN